MVYVYGSKCERRRSRAYILKGFKIFYLAVCFVMGRL